MSRQSHDDFLKRSARGALSKERERRHKDQWSADEVRSLKIQTVEPWKRIVFGILGISTATGGVLTFSEDNRGLGVLLIVVSLVLMFVATFGIKKSVDAVLNTFDVLDIVGGVVDLFDL